MAANDRNGGDAPRLYYGVSRENDNPPTGAISRPRVGNEALIICIIKLSSCGPASASLGNAGAHKKPRRAAPAAAAAPPASAQRGLRRVVATKAATANVIATRTRRESAARAVTSPEAR